MSVKRYDKFGDEALADSWPVYVLASDYEALLEQLRLCNIDQCNAEAKLAEAERDVERLTWLERWIGDNSSGGEIYPIGPEFEFGQDDQITGVLSWAIADKVWPVATMREAIDAAMGEE